MILYKIYSSLFYKYFSENKKRFIKNSDMIWHFCAPKSASTYFMHYMRNRSKNHKIITAVPHYGFRPQVTCLFTIYSNMRKVMGNKFITAHQHSGYTEDLNDLISRNHKVIIQYRNISQTVLSLIDMIDRNKNNDFSNPIFYNEKSWRTLSSVQKRELIISNYVPWHINFLKSWYYVKIPAKKYFIDYGNLIKNPDIFLNKLIDKKDIQLQENFKITNNEKKFIVGSKRKNLLSNKERLLIKKLVKSNTQRIPEKLSKMINL